VSAEPVSQCCHRDLLSNNRPYTDQAKSELTDLPKESGNGLACSRRRVPSVAIYTLAALAAQDFAHQALATPLVDFAQNPQMKMAGDLVVPASTEEAATKEARLEQRNSAVASPESLDVQEFAPETVRATESPVTVPTLTSSAPQPTRTAIAPPETEVILARTSVQNERSMSTRGLGSDQSQTSNVKPQKDEQVQFVGQGESFSSTSPASPASNSQSLSTAAPQLASATSLGAVQEVPTPARIAMRIPNRYEAAFQETVNPQQTGEAMVQARSTPPCLAYTPTRQETGQVVAQAAPTTACPSVETQQQAKDLQNELRDLENVKVEEGLQASPALSIYIPTGFGADNNTGFIGATFQQRTRYSNVSDGGLDVGIGLGDARKAVGVELSYTAASFGRSRDFGGGSFNAKVHRQLGDGLAVAAGWNGALNLGGRNDFENSVYGVVSKVFRTRDDINLPFSRVAVTAGVGNGQFRTEDAVAKNSGGVGVFGNVAVRVAQPVSLIAEWSGQDLGFGVSVAPFKNIPLVITPAVRDVVGAGDGPRFVLGTGLAFKF